jgi:hypothetical protein
MIPVPHSAPDFWTMVLALATVGVVIVAWRGLRSLGLTRTEMKNRATRESAQCAIDRCDEMSRQLLPTFTELFRELTGKGVPLFVDNPDQVSFEEKEETKKINRAIKWMGALDDGQLQRALQLMNGLECWSMPFTHDPALAAEKVAFKPCSAVFCQMVMSLYPALLTQRRTNPASGPFQNVVTLFNGWYAKQAQGPMLEQLERFQSDGAKLPPTIGNQS